MPYTIGISITNQPLLQQRKKTYHILNHNSQSTSPRIPILLDHPRKPILKHPRPSPRPQNLPRRLPRIQPQMRRKPHHLTRTQHMDRRQHLMHHLHVAARAHAPGHQIQLVGVRECLQERTRGLQRGV